MIDMLTLARKVVRFTAYCIHHPKDGFNRLKMLNSIAMNIDNIEDIERMKNALINRDIHNVFDEVFAKGEYLKLYEAIKPNTILLDLGANVGDTAIYFALNNNIIKIISYESSPEAFQRLLKNIKIYKKIEPHNNAVMPKDGFVINKYDIPKSWNTVRKARKGIKAITLASILSKYKGHGIAIKCDIEGSEKDLFKTDLSDIYAIEVEYHKGCYESVRHDLEKRGFKIENFKTTKGRGLIFAFRR